MPHYQKGCFEMTVPKSKRGVAKSAYVVHVRAVLNMTRTIMRKWPKSRMHLETEHVMRIAYDAYADAASACAIYADLPGEHALKLQKLNCAYGAMHALGGLCDGWIDDTPTVRTEQHVPKGMPHDQFVAVYGVQDPSELDDFCYKKAVSPRVLKNYAGAVACACSTLSGAIKYQRKALKTSLKKYPSFTAASPC